MPGIHEIKLVECWYCGNRYQTMEDNCPRCKTINEDKPDYGSIQGMGVHVKRKKNK